MTSPGRHEQAPSEQPAGVTTGEPDARFPGWPTTIEVLVPGDRAGAWSRVLAEALGRRFAVPTKLRRVPTLKARAGIPFGDVERLVGRAPSGHSAWMDTRLAASSEDVPAWAGRLVVNATGHDPLDLCFTLRPIIMLSDIPPSQVPSQ